jgi:hypothetical protein
LLLNVAGFVKSPSAALGCNFFVAARLAFGAYYETIVPVNFYEIINVSDSQKEEGKIWIHVHGAVSPFWMRRTPTK